MVFRYLDLPKLNLIEFCNQHNNDIFKAGSIGEFKAFDIITDNTLLEIQKIFFPYLKRIQNKRIFIWYQTMNPTFNNKIHTDPREYAISYILNQGGNNVSTNFYNDEKQLIESHIIKNNSWHILNTKTLHSVSGIETKRTAISISLIQKVKPEFMQWLREKSYESILL